MFRNLPLAAVIAIALMVGQICVAQNQPDATLQNPTEATPTAPAFKAISGQIDPDGTVEVIAKLSQDAAPSILQTTLQYRTWSGGSPLQESYAIMDATKGTITGSQIEFTISSNDPNVDQLEYFLELRGGTLPSVSAHYFASFADLRLLAVAQSDAQAKDAKIKSLTTAIIALQGKIGGINPKTISLINGVIVGAQTASFHLQTDNPGNIRVDAVRVDTGVTDDTFTSSDGTRDHAVKFAQLNPGHHYRFIGYILDQLRNNKVVDSSGIDLTRQNSLLDITTLASLPIPNVTLGTAVATSNTIVLPLAVDDGYISVECDVLSDPIHNKYTKIDSRGGWSIDQYGVVSPVPSASPYTFSALQANTSYLLKITAINSRGGLTPELDLKEQTNPDPPPFTFAGALQLNVGVNGVEATWTATSAPATGKFTVKFGGNEPIVSQDAVISGNQLTAKLDVAGLTKFFSNAQAAAEKDEAAGPQPKPSGGARASNPQGTNNSTAPPTMTFLMTDAAGTVQQQQIAINFTIPTTQQIQTAKSQGVVTPQQADSLTRVAQSASTGRPVKWSDVLMTGLSFLISLAK